METASTVILNVLTALGALVAAGGGLGLIVYGIFKVLAEKWLNNKFEERLADYKHKQQKELEHLKHEISKLMDRATKLHQREFDVIPEAWGKMNDAYNKARHLTSIMQQHANVSYLTHEQLEEFLTDTSLLEWQKVEIRTRNGMDRQDYYQKAILPHRINETWSACVDLNVYLRKNGIFMPPEIQTKFDSIADAAFNAVHEFKLNEELEIRPRERKAHTVLHEQGEQMVKDLQTMVQSRLWAGIGTPSP